MNNLASGYLKLSGGRELYLFLFLEKETFSILEISRFEIFFGGMEAGAGGLELCRFISKFAIRVKRHRKKGNQDSRHPPMNLEQPLDPLFKHTFGDVLVPSPASSVRPRPFL